MREQQQRELRGEEREPRPRTPLDGLRADRGELSNGFGDALSLAFELIATPAIFGGLGFLLDRAIGTTPLFLLVFSLFTLCYVVWKTWAAYERQMDAEEAALRERRAARLADRSTPGAEVRP